MVKLHATLTGVPPSLADAVAAVEAIAAVLPVGMRSINSILDRADADITGLAVTIAGRIELADVPALKAAVGAAKPEWLTLANKIRTQEQLAAGPRAAWAAEWAAVKAANVADVQKIYLAITASEANDTLKDQMRALVLAATGKAEEV